MADITMCRNEDCPLKDTCYRYTATASEYRQSYFFQPPSKIVDGNFECEYYWETKEE